MNNKITLGLLSIIIVLFIIFGFNINLNHFIQGHEGHAGPHMLAVALNGLNNNDANMFFDEKFLSLNGVETFSIYNHHPKLFFYLIAKILSFFSYKFYLPVAYNLALIFNLTGVFVFYYTVKKYTEDTWYSFFLILCLLGVSNVSELLNLSTLDSLSILSCCLLFNFMISFEKINSIKLLLGWSLVIIVLLNISWYNHLILYMFGLVKFISYLKNKLLFNSLLKYKIIIFYVAGCSTLYIIFSIFKQNSLFEINNVISGSGSAAKGFANYNINRFDLVTSLKGLVIYFIKSTPFFFLFIYLKETIFHSLKINFPNNLKDTILAFSLAVLLFFSMDLRWNIIHNFLALYIVPFGLISFVLMSKNNIKITYLYFVIQLCVTILITVYYFNLDIKESNSNKIIFDSLTELDIKKEKYFLYIQGKSISELNDDEIPENFNKGRLFYLASMPFSKGISDSIIEGSTIIIHKNGTFTKK
tara:strand:- start:532 stop:1950 length:1419 start_codon:yes stop_codon:yes gene_type:complete